MHHFVDAYALHQAASATLRRANRYAIGDAEIVKSPEDKARSDSQRAVLTVAAKLMILERDRMLDEFCADWLRNRNLPIPDYEPQSSVGVQRPSGTDETVQGEVRNDSVGSQSTDSGSNQAGTQPSGGISIP